MDFAEFLQYITVQMKDAQMSDEVTRLAFQTFDHGAKGYINAEDIERMIGIFDEELTMEEIKTFLNECDLDGDGQLDFGGESGLVFSMAY